MMCDLLMAYGFHHFLLMSTLHVWRCSRGLKESGVPGLDGNHGRTMLAGAIGERKAAGITVPLRQLVARETMHILDFCEIPRNGCYQAL